MTKSERNYEQVKRLLTARLNKLGHISLKSVWLLIRDQVPLSYDVIRIHFKKLMQEAIDEGRAEILANGNYWIYKNKKANAQHNLLNA